MKKLFVTTALLVACVGLTASVAYAATPAERLAATARVTMPEARAKALAAHPGRITDAELEREKGGSGLRYSFDIDAGGKTFEVGVDAQSGAILENKAEGPNPD